MLFGKSKKKLVGTNIEASCEYCGHNTGEGFQVECTLNHSDGQCCEAFVYDPLKRTPKSLPPLMDYDEDEFKL